MSWKVVCEGCGNEEDVAVAEASGNWRRVHLLIAPIGNHAPGRNHHFCSVGEAGDFLLSVAQEAFAEAGV